MNDTRIAALHALIADDDDLFAYAIDHLTDSLDDDSAELRNPLFAALTDMIDAISADNATALFESFEFCPMHHCDYRICLDDADDECAHLH